jgi:hypothetical protein
MFSFPCWLIRRKETACEHVCFAENIDNNVCAHLHPPNVTHTMSRVELCTCILFVNSRHEPLYQCNHRVLPK